MFLLTYELQDDELNALTYELWVTSATIFKDQSADDFMSFTRMGTYEVPVRLVVQPFVQFALTSLLGLPWKLDICL
jgi:hypothetical protein